jgi:hypothetical protein
MWSAFECVLRQCRRQFDCGINLSGTAICRLFICTHFARGRRVCHRRKSAWMRSIEQLKRVGAQVLFVT